VLEYLKIKELFMLPGSVLEWCENALAEVDSTAAMLEDTGPAEDKLDAFEGACSELEKLALAPEAIIV
jgi:hypothetical protein